MLQPVIHPNGTSQDTLLEAALDAANALRAADKALQRLAPNARDYYPLGSDAFVGALEQYRTMRARLVATLSQVEAYAAGIADAQPSETKPLAEDRHKRVTDLLREGGAVHGNRIILTVAEGDDAEDEFDNLLHVMGLLVQGEA